MSWRKTRTLMRLIVAIFALSLGLGQVRAQSQAAQPQSAEGAQKTTAQPVAAAKVPKGCENGKMRCMSNKVRWEAAIQNADRRAKAMKDKGGKK